MTEQGCPFCDFQDQSVVIHQDAGAFAVVSHAPINRYHVLVIPRAHFESFVDLPDGLAAHIFLLAKRLSLAVRRVCRPDAISHLSDDDLTGRGHNLVAHYKLHLIPRYADDGVVTDWNPGRTRGPKSAPITRGRYARRWRMTDWFEEIGCEGMKRGSLILAGALLLTIVSVAAGARPQSAGQLLNRRKALAVLKGCGRSLYSEGCDDGAAQYLIGLYGRGDRSLLAPLLDAGPVSDGALSEALGSFYAEVPRKSRAPS